MFKDHKDFIRAVLVFSVLFWGTYFVGMRLIPWMYYSNDEIDPGFGKMLERQGELDESKV